MNSRITLTFIFLVVLQLNLIAQQSKAITFYSASQLDSALNVKTERLSRLLGTSKDGSPYLLVIRTKPGEVEVHEQYDDVAIVRSGKGILKTGSLVTGNKVSGTASAGEWIGGVIQNATERKLAPGDFIIIPATLPHQYIPLAGDTLTYWTIKVKLEK